MGQQVADRHALLARPLKLGDVTLDRRIEGERALVHEQHARGGGGEASAVEPEGSGRRGGKAATTRERGPRGSSDRRMAGNGRGYACEDDLPHGCESETITPKPTG